MLIYSGPSPNGRVRAKARAIAVPKQHSSSSSSSRKRNGNGNGNGKATPHAADDATATVTATAKATTTTPTVTAATKKKKKNPLLLASPANDKTPRTKHHQSSSFSSSHRQPSQQQQQQNPSSPLSSTPPPPPPPPYRETAPPLSPPPPFSATPLPTPTPTPTPTPPRVPEIPLLSLNPRARAPAHPPQRPSQAPPYRSKPKAAWSSAHARPVQDAYEHQLQQHQHQHQHQLAARSVGSRARDRVSAKFDDVITAIDNAQFRGDEDELVIPQNVDVEPVLLLRGGWGFPGRDGRASRAVNSAVNNAVTHPKSSNVFAKVGLYANSKLPLDLPPLKLYLPSYPLICLAAQFSERVYVKPARLEREMHVDADWRTGTKAMVIKSVPLDHVSTIIFAVRGTSTFMDWAVNLSTAPTSPKGFLPDAGNLCHAGFLSAARKMVKPVAARLRALLEENPSRAACSLLMTGHSAGGAVASLLYAHMLAGDALQAESELNVLAGCFRRVHCITFGAPPVSLLPLTKPTSLHTQQPRFQKSLFLTFINEGDPVPRADKRYVRSLIDLYTSPPPKAPVAAPPLQGPAGAGAGAGPSCPLLSNPPPASAESNNNNKPKFQLPSFPKLSLRPRPVLRQHHSDPLPTTNTTPPPYPPPSQAGPIWPVPPSTLSVAGRAVILRRRSGKGKAQAQANSSTAKATRRAGGLEGEEEEEDVEACVLGGPRHEQERALRGVVFGDPVMHMMRLYKRRVEALAMRKVVGYA